MLTHPQLWIFSSCLGPAACCMQCGGCLYSNNARCHQMPQFAPKNPFSGRPLSPLPMREGYPLLLPLLHLCSAPRPLARCCYTITTFWGKPLYIYFFTSYLHQLQKVAVVVTFSGTLQASPELQQMLARMNCLCTALPASMRANHLWSCRQSVMVSIEQNECKSVECSIFHLSKFCWQKFLWEKLYTVNRLRVKVNRATTFLNCL